MMRVLVYGNSHVAAWQAAWDGWAVGRPEFEMTFFSLPERIFQRYRFRAAGLFAARRSVTTEELDRVRAINGGSVDCRPAEADLAVCVGLSWAPERAVAFAALGDVPEGGASDGGRERAMFSAGFVQAALDEACAEVVGGWPVPPRMPGRMVVFGRPVYAETCLHSTHRLYAPWQGAALWPEAAGWFLAAYRDRLVARAAAVGIDFLPPPVALSGTAGLTRTAYLAEGGGVVDPADPGARGDHSHMNAAYGRACIEHLQQHLAGCRITA